MIVLSLYIQLLLYCTSYLHIPYITGDWGPSLFHDIIKWKILFFRISRFNCSIHQRML
jgi:hypothetical protein